MSDFKLEQSDLISPTWIRLQGFLKDRLDVLRLQNDHDSDPQVTAKIRGRIAEIKALLALGKPGP